MVAFFTFLKQIQVAEIHKIFLFLYAQCYKFCYYVIAKIVIIPEPAKYFRNFLERNANDRIQDNMDQKESKYPINASPMLGFGTKISDDDQKI